MNKKGGLFNRETMLVAFGLLVAGLAIMGMLNSAKNVLNSEALFENYLARDLALIMDAVYAAPGEVKYTYNLNPRRTYYVEITEGLVKVSTESNFEPKDTFSYRFASDKGIQFTTDPAPYSGSLERMRVVIIKDIDNHAVTRISAKLEVVP